MQLYGTSLFLFIAALSCNGQGKLISSVPIVGKVHFASVDRPGDLYVVMEDGLIRKFDLNGKEIASKKFNSPPTLFDPRDGTLSFAWFRSTRQLVYLSPDMSSTSEVQVHPEFAISPWQVCPSKNELWILDSADLSLKQTSGKAATVAYDVAWPGTKPNPLNITFMREYQNFLFVLDEGTGLHLFNSLGKKIRQIDEKKLQWFSFLGEELYYLKSQSVHMMDLYSGESREIHLPSPCQFALLTDQRMILVREGKLEFFEFTP
jgi:hypothetical protein